MNYCIKAVQGSLQSLSNIITGISSMGSSFANIFLKNTGIAFSLVILSFILFLREKHNLKTIRKFKKNAREEDQKFGNSISNFMNVVEYVQRTLLGFQTASEEIEKSSQDFINANNKQYKVRSKKKIEKAITNFLVRSGAFIGLIAIGKITTGELISALNSIAVFKKNADNFTRYFVELKEHLQDYKDAMDIIKTPSKITDKENAIDLTEKLQGKVPSIEFKNVSYSYKGKKGQNKEVLKNLNLKIKAGEKIAIVGENGSGKTTMLNLLERAYDLEENSGSIEIDGINVKDLKVKSLRQNIGYVPSNIELLPGKTIVENLTFGVTGISEKDVAFTLARLKFSENIDIKDENVINNSSNKGLSDGQKKKLCLARILLLKSPIAVFDEPTNALDKESVKAITNAMIEHCKDKTGILISHDEKVAEKFADRIVKLKDGKISEITELEKNEEGDVINRHTRYIYKTDINKDLKLANISLQEK